MTFRVVPSILGKRRLFEVYRDSRTLAASPFSPRKYSADQRPSGNGTPSSPPTSRSQSSSTSGEKQSGPSSTSSSSRSSWSSSKSSDSSDWDNNPDLSISKFSELPNKNFGVNQHMIINEEFKEALRQILWKFKAPIRYAFAYGSGVFTQNGSGHSSKSTSSSLHSGPPEAISKIQKGGQKMIDFIFGVSYTQHWHSLNLQEHRDHYSGVGSLGSYAVSKLQDSFGAGVYFNPFITVNGTLIKYGVVNIDTLCRDLSQWDTLYLAGRLQKPVKILRDNPSVRLANQMNLISAVRTALLLLPPSFTEHQLYSTIAGISYTGDPRMSLPAAEDPQKILNIVQGQLPNFRRLYAPLIDNLPNISFNDSACANANWFDDPTTNAKLEQDMDPIRRGNMVRRLPKSFRAKLYFEYQSKFGIPRGEFDKMLEESRDEDGAFRKQQGGVFEQRIAKDSEGIQTEVRQVIEKTIKWPSVVQAAKGVVTAGLVKSWRYGSEKRQKAVAGEAREKQKSSKETKDK